MPFLAAMPHNNYSLRHRLPSSNGATFTDTPSTLAELPLWCLILCMPAWKFSPFCTCPLCRALRFQSEPLNCCHNGKVNLPPLGVFPSALKSLFTDSTELATNFQRNIRQYNSAFSFASFGAQMVQVPGRGPYCFKIHGQTYHSTCTLHPPDGQERQYGQLYIIEADQAVTTRMNAAPNSQCLSAVMDIISQVMVEHSPYASAFQHMHAVEQAEEQDAAEQDRQPQIVRLFFKRGPDCRRYNEPTHNEVAAVFVGEDGAPPAHRDVVVYPRDRPPERIPYISSHLDPMCYPVLFPRGELGWHDGMLHSEEHRTATRNRLTMQQFYGHRLAVRGGFSPIHSSGKLFQQYIVDAYV